MNSIILVYEEMLAAGNPNGFFIMRLGLGRRC